MRKARLNLVGIRVKRARGQTQPPLTQLALSQRLAKRGVFIDRAGIAKIETGIRGVLDYELVALARSLNVGVAWLVGVEA